LISGWVHGCSQPRSMAESGHADDGFAILFIGDIALAGATIAGISVVAAAQVIIALFAEEIVAAFLAIDVVIPGAGQYVVVSGTAEDTVVAIAAVDGVALAVAIEGIAEIAVTAQEIRAIITV